MGQLATLAWQDGVGRQAGDLGGLAQHDVADVEDDGVLGHLLKYPALVEEGPDQAVVLVVLLVPGPVLLPSQGGPVHLVRLVVVVDDLPGGQDVLLRVHTLQLEPPGTLQVTRPRSDQEGRGSFEKKSERKQVNNKKGSDWLTVSHQRVKQILSH